MRYSLKVALLSFAFILSSYQYAFAAALPLESDFETLSLNSSPKGYLVYCPCMGRFGNQVAQLLGAMALAHDTGRTLVLPPFIEYKRGKTLFVPFEHYFSLAAIQSYVPAVTMQQFLADPTRWPLEKRQLFCTTRTNQDGCAELKGNPQKTFWDHHSIEFKGDVTAQIDVENSASVIQQLPIATYPVIALASAPGSFPVASNNQHLQRYLEWSEKIRNDGDTFIAQHLTRPFIAVHLRNGSDWQNACQLGEGRQQFMASPQCGLSYQPSDIENINKVPSISTEMCLPGPSEVVRAIAQANQNFVEYTSVFIGTDNNDYKSEITDAAHNGVKIVRGNSAMLDLYVFTQADMFIANCVSSFSSLAVRDRRSKGFPSVFFGFDNWDIHNSYVDQAIQF